MTSIYPSIPFESLRPMRHPTELQDFECDPIQPTTVTLPPAVVEWAVQVCQQEADPGQQWVSFLRAMALRGVQHWLEDGASSLNLFYDPARSPALDVQAEVNGFRLCVVGQGTLTDGQVSIPKSTLDDPQHFVHLYILAEVKEEVDQVTIIRGLRRDRLLLHQQQGNLLTVSDGTYKIPVHYFDTPPDDILLYLNCLNPSQLTATSQTIQQASQVAQPSSQSRINVSLWLQDSVNALAESVAHTLTWMLLPPLSVSHAMMSADTPSETLEEVLRQLELIGVHIPAEARGAYTDLQPLGLPLRLYALTWTLMHDAQPEWCLFLVLGSASGEQILPGTRLVVRDAMTTLTDSTLSSHQHANHLYAQVFGAWEEAFNVTVELPNGSTLNWPPFVFRPNEG